MNQEMHGKKISAIHWPNTESEKGRCLMAGYGECDEIYLSATYHGSHDEFWIVQMKDGEEVARHNTAFVETIEWAKQTPSNAPHEGPGGFSPGPLDAVVGPQTERSKG